MLHLVLTSGLSNRLLALLSGMRYALMTQQKLRVHWVRPVGRYGLAYQGEVVKDEHLYYFFREIPDIELAIWPDGEIRMIWQTLRENWLDRGVEIIYDGTQVIPELMNNDFPSDFAQKISESIMTKIPQSPEEQKKEVAIVMPTSPFGIEGVDQASQVVRNYRQLFASGDEMKPRFKNTFEKQLAKFGRKLKPIGQLQRVIDFQARMLRRGGQRLLGIHIRRTDLETRVGLEELDSRIAKIYHDYYGVGKYQVMICSDDYQLEERYVKRYGFWHYFDRRKADNNLEGVQKSLVDLYLLASCDLIFGTRGSSFSYLSFILAKDSTQFGIHS